MVLRKQFAYVYYIANGIPSKPAKLSVIRGSDNMINVLGKQTAVEE